MSVVIAFVDAHPLAALFGALGLACQLTWPLFSARRAILAVQFGIGAGYAAQYALLGAWSGAGIAALGATQTALTFFADEHPALRRIAILFLPAAGAICVATWNGAASLMAAAACTLVMAGRMQSDTLRLRLFSLSAAPFGIGHDIFVGAALALVGAIASAGVAAVALVREFGRRHNQTSLDHQALASPCAA